MTFRDDMEAARIRAEQLDENNRRLAGELQAAYRGELPTRGLGYSVAVLGGTLLGLCALSVVAGFLLLRRAAPTAEPVAYTAPAHTAPTPVVTAAPKPSPPAAVPADLVVEDVRVGTGAVTKPGDTISVHYVGTLTSGVEFDSSRKHGNKPFSFKLGQGHVIKGWEEGLKGMRVGGERKLTIPPAMGYGERGAGSLIPPNATLVFDVELLSIDQPAP